MNMLSRFLVVAMIIPPYLFSCTQKGIESNTWGNYFTYPFGWNTYGYSYTYPMLEPGDEIVDMVITTGAEDAFPLWSICGPQKVNGHTIKADCGELSHDNLLIGYTLGTMELFDPPIGWEELNWEMSVDGHPIDLPAFGVYDFVQIFHPSHSGREIFKVSRVWDVVLVNPAPGMHRIHGQAQTPDGGETYTWLVNFTVPAPSK